MSSDLDRTFAAKDAPIGGQAVLEGVMMRGVSTWAVAVRKPEPADLPEDAREISVQSFPLVSILKKHKVLRWPIIRGTVALYESLAIGFKALGISANAQLPEGEQEISSKAWGGTIFFALALSIGLFFILPAALTNISGAG